MTVRSIPDLIQQCKPEIKPATLKAYFYSIKRAAPLGIQKKLGSGLSVNPVSIDWISRHAAVIKRLSQLSPAVQKTTVTALQVVTNCLYGDEDPSYLAYSNLADSLRVTIEKKDALHEKSPTQEENWTTMEVLYMALQEMPTDTPMEKKRRLIAALYTLQPPARNNYGEMELIEQGEPLEEDVNYLIMKDEKPYEFFFQDFKNVKSRGFVTVPLDKDMFTELEAYLNGRTTGYLFDGSLSKTQVSSYLAIAFKPTGKKITINLIRHIVASNAVDITKREMQSTLAAGMMHGSATQVTYAKA